MTLREKLIVLRDKAGISQMALAHQLGVSKLPLRKCRGETKGELGKSTVN